MLPRGLFLLAEIAKSCLFSTAETPLQIQRGFPAEVSDVRSTGTGLPTSSPGLQLSQGEKAVYQHTQPRPRRAAALLTHTAAQTAQLSCTGNSIFTVPNKRGQPAHQHHLALVPSEALLHTQKDFRVPTAESHCEGHTWAAPFTSASQEQNTAPVSQVSSACV